MRAIGIHAAMVVPMVAAGRVIGVITFASAESARTFTQSDLELAEELGRRAGTAVENARLYAERSHIAATLQRGLLPDELPAIEGLRLASLYRPAGEENLVGGDFYDAFPTPSGWMLLVGDVTGRGAEAAALTGQARHTLRTAGVLLGDPDAALEQLNRALAQRTELTPCTVALVHVTPDLTTATCAAPAIPSRCSCATASRARRALRPDAGRVAGQPVAPGRVALRPGDVLVLYSDGVTDTVGEDGRFGESACWPRCRAFATPTGRWRRSTPRSTPSSAVRRPTTRLCSH